MHKYFMHGVLNEEVYMSAKWIFTVNDFAKFSRTTRDTLLHYDKIGLLEPISRGENNYRYYSGGQLAVVNVIRTLQALGLTLKEIKQLKDNRNPQMFDEYFIMHSSKIKKQIDSWIRAEKLLTFYQNTIRSVKNIDENKISIQHIPAEPIILGEINDYNENKNAYDSLLIFYQSMNYTYPDIDLNYPVWAVFSEARIKNNDWVWPDRYYLANPEGHDKKPAALYATGYTRGGYGQSHGLYKKIINYIDDNDYEICGDAYEEYPLNEVCIKDENNYLMKIMITVRQRKIRHV